MDQFYDIGNEPMILFPSTFAKFKEYENFVDVLSLYMFYYYTAKYQKTNVVKCTTSFASIGTGISERRIRAAKTVLLDLGLIEDIKKQNNVGHIYYYVFVRFSLSSSVANMSDWSSPNSAQTTLANFHSVDKCKTNTNTSNKQNSISSNKEKINKKESRKNSIYNKPRPDTEAYGEFQNVWLKEQELQKLYEKYLKRNVLPMIDKISAYIENYNPKYKNHYAALTNWLLNDKERNPDKYKIERSFWDK